MNQEELQVAAFEIILHSGTARTEIHEAFADMREGRFDEAEAKLDHSNEEILEAHHAQNFCKTMQVVWKSRLKLLWCMLKTI